MVDHTTHHYKKNTIESEDVFWRVIRTVLLGMVCIILLFSVYKMYKKYHKTTTTLRDSYTELEKLQQNKISTEHAIERLSTDEGREYEIRDRFRVTKPDEKIIVVIDNSADIPKINIDQSLFVKFKEWLYNI
jgi:cell division protein FtsB